MSSSSDKFIDGLETVLEDNPRVGMTILETLEENVDDSGMSTDEMGEHVGDLYSTENFETLVHRKLVKMEKEGILEQEDGYRLSHKGRNLHREMTEGLMETINTYNDVAVMIHDQEAGKAIMEDLRDSKSRKRQGLEDTATDYFERHSEVLAGRKVSKMEEAGLVTELNGNYYATIHGVKMYEQLFGQELGEAESNSHLTGS